MTTRYEKSLSKLQQTFEWSLMQDISSAREFLLSDKNLPRVFLASGGSLSAAYFAAGLSLEAGCPAVAMTPYQFIFGPWSKIPSKILLISSSGRNVDIVNALKTSLETKASHIAAITLKNNNHLQTIMHGQKYGKCFSFHLAASDGFIATNSILAFYALFIRIYKDIDLHLDIPQCQVEAREFVNTLMHKAYNLPTNDMDDYNAAIYKACETDCFYVLYSPETRPIAIDLESRFVEGAVGCIICSDYRNFAHGRFNWFQQRKGQSCIIALSTPGSVEFTDSIISELPPDIPVLELSTTMKDSFGSIDLLVKGMYVTKYLSDRWGLDIGAPKVEEFGTAIFKKCFALPENHEN